MTSHHGGFVATMEIWNTVLEMVKCHIKRLLNAKVLSLEDTAELR